METKYVRVPFDVELAKEISNGSKEGRVVTRQGLSVRIICWNIKNEKFQLGALVLSNNKEDFISYTMQGNYYSSKTVEHDYDLMLEIPEYMSFKDGDVVVTDDRIVIIRNPKMDNLNGFCFSLYVAYDCKGKTLFYCADFINQEKVRFAKEEEKQILIKRLKASKQPKDKEYLKRFFGIENSPKVSNSEKIGKNEFKPFDKVLVRDSKLNEWNIDIFRIIVEDGDKCGYKYNCFCDSWNYCIPYNDETAHLLGTTENYE